METKDIPFDLLNELTSNETAMRKFSMLTGEEKERVSDLTHTFNSKSEMKKFVQKFAEDDYFWKT